MFSKTIIPCLSFLSFSVAESYVKLYDVKYTKETVITSSGTANVKVRRSDRFTLVTCSGLETGNIGHVILSLATDTCVVLVLSASHVSQLKSDEETSNVYCLKTKSWEDKTPCNILTAPNISTGIKTFNIKHKVYVSFQVLLQPF